MKRGKEHPRSGSGADFRARLALGLTALLAILFVAGTWLAPYGLQRGWTLGGLLQLAYEPLCHQLPERSLTLGSGHVAVCARCTGLYLGGLAGLVLAAFGRWTRRSPTWPWLAVAAAPSVVDYAWNWIGTGLPNLPRLMLAFPAGFVAAVFVAYGIRSLVRDGIATTPHSGQILSNRPIVEEFDGNTIA